MDPKRERPSTLLVYSAPRTGADPWMDFLPIGLGYLQAMLKSRGFPCRIANLTGRSRGEVLAYFRERRPDVLGVSMFTFNRGRSAELLRWAREACPRAVLLAGGPHPTHLAREVFQDCPALDAIVRGEGEIPLLDLVRRLADQTPWQDAPGLILPHRSNDSVPPVEDLDSVGLPVEHLEADYCGDRNHLGYLSTSRGCPGTCNFCNTPEFWGSKVRFRSAASVLREMRLLRERYGLTYFSFRDDTFTTRKSRILELAEGIRASGLYPLWNCQSRVNLVDEERLVAMKRAGCEFIQFGVEHGSPAVLKLLDKGITADQARRAMALARKAGFNVGIYLITGIPGETWEDVEATARFLRETKPHDVQISPLAVYPGTRLYERYLAEGRIARDFFRTAGEAEVFARKDAHTARALERLQSAALKMKPRARYTPQEFAEQKRWLGSCFVTSLLCGEAAEEEGRWTEAEVEYSDIIRAEPANPWGFLKRALLWERTGKRAKARSDLKEVLRLAPGNPEAQELRELWSA